MRFENYSFEQRMRDASIYSKGAEKRIERILMNGGSISGARSFEADRIARFRSATKFAKNRKLALIGALVGSQVARPTLVYLSERLDNDIYSDTPVNRLVDKHREKIDKSLDFMLDTPYLAESVGAAVGGVVIPSILSSAIMLIGGYSPSKAL